MAETTANERQHAPGQHPDMPPPSMSVGVIGWVRQNLISSPLNVVLTILSIALIYYVLEGVLTWAVFEAQISGDSRTDCTNDGACWALIRVRSNQFMSGFYPAEEYWRVNFAAVLMVFALVSPIAVGAGLLGGPGLAGIFLLASVAYFVLYETTHTLYHLQPETLRGLGIGRSAIFWRLQSNHAHHHRLDRMAHCNFNVTFPLADKSLGSYERPASLTGDGGS